MQNPLHGSYPFVEQEKEILKFWEDNHAFEALKKKNENGPKFRFIDGPITANNAMGVHHVWGRTLKDTYLKYRAMNGCDTHYRNGFDSQGLWVEVEVEKELGFETKHDIETYGLDKFTDKCIERVQRCSAIITEQSKRLGQWMDWDNSYFTYTDENITGIWAFLKKCHESGWIKEVYKPMPWCSRCGTSLSEHEMTGSYKEVEHDSVFFRLPILSGEHRGADILVWTTTPWTLSANVALAVHPELNYVKFTCNDAPRPLITVEAYYRQKFEKKEGTTLLASFKGESLEGTLYETCFPELPALDFEHKIVLWDEVTDEDGCGVVHIAPGCGAEDFELGNRVGLPNVIPVDEYGVFYEGFGFYSGKNAQEVREEVFAELRSRDKMFYVAKIKHSYPVCWRCKREIIFRLVKEWAISVDELRPRLIANARKVKWDPPYQGKRMEDWLTNMSDWNISRKRYYGLPLPFYKCPDCGELTVVGSKEELRALAVNPEAVDQIPHLHRPYIDEVKIACPHCGKAVERVTQVGDVWLDAGIVPFSTIKYFSDREYWKQFFPAEYVLEMKEQVRLWFYSMLFMSTVLVDEPPYERVGTYSVVVGENGQKFSKTGYMIRFDEAADVIGADASRYIFSSSPTSTDVRFGYGLGDEAKRKLLGYWNLCTFFATYADIDGVKIDLSDLKYESLSDVDKWLYLKTNEFVRTARKYFDDYSTREIIVAFENFVNDISNFYVRVNRARFWKSECDADKQNAYTVLYYAVKTITGAMAPIIPFMTETVWQYFVKKYAKEEVALSVMLSDYPKADLSEPDAEGEAILRNVENIRNLTSLGLKLRNEKQIKVRQPLPTLYVEKNAANEEAVKAFGRILLSEMNVEKIELAEDTSAFESNFLTVNFKVAGRVLKAQANAVKNYLAELGGESQSALAAKAASGEAISIDSLGLSDIPAEVFLVNAKPKDHVAVVRDQSGFVALDCEISEALLAAGICRDIVRQCQVFRKNAGFDVSDRICLSFETASEKLNAILEEKKESLARDLLATVTAVETPEFTGHIDLDGESLTVQMKRV